MPSLTKKQIEKHVEKAFYRHSHGMQFNIISLGKIKADIMASFMACEDLDVATPTILAKYRVQA